VGEVSGRGVVVVGWHIGSDQPLPPQTHTHTQIMLQLTTTATALPPHLECFEVIVQGVTNQQCAPPHVAHDHALQEALQQADWKGRDTKIGGSGSQAGSSQALQFSLHCTTAAPTRVYESIMCSTTAFKHTHPHILQPRRYSLQHLGSYATVACVIICYGVAWYNELVQ
jgi:hypothetical protein